MSAISTEQIADQIREAFRVFAKNCDNNCSKTCPFAKECRKLFFRPKTVYLCEVVTGEDLKHPVEVPDPRQLDLFDGEEVEADTCSKPLDQQGVVE